MKKGGYQILDLKNTSFTVGSSVEISGAYETIESTDKAILVSGLVVGGKQYDDVFAEVDTNNSNYVINVYDYTLTIMANDMVVVGVKQTDYFPTAITKITSEAGTYYTTEIENNTLCIIKAVNSLFGSTQFNTLVIVNLDNDITAIADNNLVGASKNISIRAAGGGGSLISIKQKIKGE